MKDIYFVSLVLILAIYYISGMSKIDRVQNEFKQLNMALQNYNFVQAEKE